MPTYEYRCPKGHEFERFQSMSEPPVATCPECGAEAERLLSAGAGLIFKGSGFYITDYRSEGYKKAAEADRANGGGSTAKPTGSKGGSASGGSAKGGGSTAGSSDKSDKSDSSKDGGTTGGGSGSSASGGTKAGD